MKKIEIEIPEGYEAKWVNGVLTLVDEAPKDITERIKTFEDACKWCGENGKRNLNHEYMDGLKAFENTKDILAYLKLRIITCALNEGETGDCIFYPYWEDGTVDYINSNYNDSELILTMPSSLLFRNYKLAEYAAAQFKDIYMDFCYKGKE